MSTNGFNLDKSIELASLSLEAYNQYEAWKNKKTWPGPAGYKLEREIDVPYEDDTMPFGYICSKDGAAFIVWRGTDNPQEWIEDAKFKQVPCSFLKGAFVEHGFWELYTTRRDDKVPSPRENVLDWVAKMPSGMKLFVTGHSLGGATATLNAADLAAGGHALSCYSFASPRTGDPNFANEYRKLLPNAWRVYNTLDEVPKLPPELCPPILLTFHYKHVEPSFAVTFGKPIDLGLDHSIQGYIDALKALRG